MSQNRSRVASSSARPLVSLASLADAELVKNFTDRRGFMASFSRIKNDLNVVAKRIYALSPLCTLHEIASTLATHTASIEYIDVLTGLANTMLFMHMRPTYPRVILTQAINTLRVYLESGGDKRSSIILPTVDETSLNLFVMNAHVVIIQLLCTLSEEFTAESAKRVFTYSAQIFTQITSPYSRAPMESPPQAVYHSITHFDVNGANTSTLSTMPQDAVDIACVTYAAVYDTVSPNTTISMALPMSDTNLKFAIQYQNFLWSRMHHALSAPVQVAALLIDELTAVCANVAHNNKRLQDQATFNKNIMVHVQTALRQQRATSSSSSDVAIDDRLVKLDALIPMLQTKLDAPDSRVETLQTKLDASDARVEKLEALVQTLQTKLDASEAASEARWTKLDAELAQMTTRTQAVETDMAKAKGIIIKAKFT
jgi:hypothetical protein